ncbi:peptidase E [Actinocorallia sp. API 0066]|uniref:Type 1 glutamine amidotransferase-like domain-containing protein n=1 Tax=Actinocorallia sp. API 0066 TaxID=2896846 RepID=UPI001E5D5DFF|nr:Type 1 glutamine amidotransferase-like domain-containing protein [Actinocorallia sp. API 0066]MCD0451610.1 peptidase E [Actinocorallia sp. API 0066]
MNAYDYHGAERRGASLRREFEALEGLGLEPVEVDLRRYFGAGPEKVREVLAGFDGVYFRGGSVFVLRRALRLSGADEVLKELLADDAIVYAGYSAAACVLGPTLRGIEGEVDDPAFVPDGYPEGPALWDGLGILPFCVAPHYRSDHPETLEIEQTVQYLIDHHLPFVALRDGQAIVVEGDDWTVV